MAYDLLRYTQCWLLCMMLFGGFTLRAQGIRANQDLKTRQMLQWLDTHGDNAVISSINEYDSRQFMQLVANSYSKMPELYQQIADGLANDYLWNYGRDSGANIDSTQYGYEQDVTEPKRNYRSPILKYFYGNPHHFFSVEEPQFNLYVDPIIGLEFGQERDNSRTVLQNTRGARIGGHIDGKVYFFSQVLENQQIFYHYINDFVDKNQAIPGNGFYKDFQSSVVDGFKGYDYLNASGYMGIPVSKSIGVEFGHGQHFIGNGVRSLLLSDFGNNYFYLKMNTKIWKLHYQNLFAEISPLSHRNINGDVLLPKKYFANHYLSFKPLKNWEVGLFESVVFNRDQFELQYLNPIILYRFIEYALGSPDNAMIGINLNVNIAKGVKLYGQGVVDELKLSELKKEWWGNKFAYQLGVSLTDLVGIHGLNIKAEHNWVRPFTYAQARPLPESPRISSTSYSHYNQALAHPLGANFSEWLIEASLVGLGKWQWYGQVVYYVQGVDASQLSTGSNILLNTDLRLGDYDQKIGQGLRKSVLASNLKASYEIVPHLLIDATLLPYIEKKDGITNRNLMGSLGLRYQLYQQTRLF